jgi:hypothetical protein
MDRRETTHARGINSVDDMVKMAFWLPALAGVGGLTLLGGTGILGGNQGGGGGGLFGGGGGLFGDMKLYMSMSMSMSSLVLAIVALFMFM